MDGLFPFWYWLAWRRTNHGSIESALQFVLFPKFTEMLVVDTVRLLDKCFILPVGPRLVPADQQNSDAQRVECVKRSQWPARALGSQLPHSRMARSYNLRTVRKPEGRTEFGEKTNRVGNIVLLILRQGTPPSAELVGETLLPMPLN
jgi:hypothetical protein